MVVDEVVGKCKSVSPRKLCAMLMIVSTWVATSGCTAWTGAHSAWQYNRYWNDAMTGHRHKSMAAKAWHSYKHCYVNQRYLKDFSRGFKAGYMDVAAGRDGCTPAFPPREYWGWKYQSCEGQARVAAWFSGYPYGAKAAEQAGVGNWTQIQTSKGIQNVYVEHGRLPSEFNGIYPVPQFDPNFQPTPEFGLPLGDTNETTIIEEGPILRNPVP